MHERPLFPNRAGLTVSKHKVVKAIEHAAVQTGQALYMPEGDRMFGGHTLRVSGARWLAELGIEVAKTQAFARSAFDIVLHYVGEAHPINRSAEVMQKRLAAQAKLPVPGESGAVAAICDATDATKAEDKAPSTASDRGFILAEEASS